MAKRKFQKRMAYALLSAFIVNGVSSGIEPIVHAAVIQQQYTKDFEESIDGFEKVYGGGIVSHVDGGLNIEAANWPDEGNYTLVVDNNSPELKDGVIEVDMKVKSDAGRLGIVFRYVDENNYNMIGYDVSGNWILKNIKDGNDVQTTIVSQGLSLQNGTTYKVKVAYTGSEVQLYVDDNLLYSGESLTTDTEGKIGFRNWGYTGNYSHVNYDNLQYYTQSGPDFVGEEYIINFDDNDVAGWIVNKGEGSVSVENGKLTTQANGSDANTFSSDENAPLIKDGYLETAMTLNNSAGRSAILFRYESPSSFAGIAYDTNGAWVWLSEGSYGTLPFTKVLEPGTEYKINIKYVGTHITIVIDDEVMYQGEISGIKTTAGRIGTRNWGWTGNYGSSTFDYFKNGKFSSVTLDSDYKYVLYNEAGTYDIPITLTGDNTLSKLTVGGNTLVEGEDYILTDNILVIKKEYIEKVKEGGTTNINIIFEDGYLTTFKLQVQLPPDEAASYIRDFSTDGIGGLSVIKGSGSAELQEDKLLFKSNGNSILIDENSPELFNSSVEFVVDPLTDAANIGAIVRYSEDDNSWTYIGQDGSGNQYGSYWYVENSNGQRRALVQDTARIYANRVKPYKIKVKVVENVVSIYLDGAEIYNGVVPELTSKKGKAGIRLGGNNSGKYQYLSVESEEVLSTNVNEVTEKEISSNDLTVKMDASFPRVIDYTLNDKKLYGQEKPIYYISINNKNYVPKVTSEFNGNEAVYHLYVEELGVTLDTRFTVENNVLTMNIENVDESITRVDTINFPNHSLVSVRSNQTNAEFNGADYENDDVKINLTSKREDTTYSNTNIAILSCDDLAASITSNSIKLRDQINYQTVSVDDYYSTGLWPNEYLYRGIDGELINEPYAKVTITDDRNKDNSVDYQDGAIALRDDIQENRLGSELVNQTYSSVAMNVGSTAHYPFLRILDNIKKFNLATDGFGQTIIIKGYQSEGHDSSHPDFANISNRLGGEEAFRILLEESDKYNANIGVHINHTEAYPEAPQYGSNIVSTVGGWSWYDDSKQIIRENDIMNEESGMGARLEELIEKAPGLDMIYVDVYMDTRWPAYKLTSKLNDLGIAVASEYAKQLGTTSVWAHHAYNGGYGTSSELARFVNHQEQDVFGGTNLFRGNSRQGINGWQGESNLNTTVSNFFTSQLPFKYLMNFPISIWEDNQITFGENNEVVSKMDNGVNVITQDGKEVARGNKIFIPWTIDNEEKIYHWNDSNSSTTWDLPNSWAGLETVYLYELSDEGKINETVVNVVNNKVTLEVKKNTGYVVYKGEKAQEKMEWSTGSLVKDMGFDSHSFEYWNKSSNGKSTDHIEVVNNSKGNTHIKVSGTDDALISQTITGLEPGQTYSASAWFEVSDGRRGTLSILTSDGKEVSEYIDRCNVKYGHTHSDKTNSYYQRVRVNFTVPEDSTTATIQLKAAEGAAGSFVNMDDVLVMKIGVSDKQGHDFFEDYENVDFGYGPFISTSSDHSHLSETNAPYTNDTIEGRYSLKIRNGNYMRTIPSTMRLKPNTTYRVGFDYISYAEQGFIAAIKSDKASEAGDTANAVLKTADLNTGTNQAVLEFTTGNYDDYYLDLTKQNNNNLIVDNVFVDEIVNISIDTLVELVNELKALDESAYTTESLNSLKDKIKDAETVINKANATEDEVKNAYNELTKAKEALVRYATVAEVNDLKATIEEMKAINSNDYKQNDKWTVFQEKIVEAEKLVKENKITVIQITSIKSELYKAKSELTKVDSADKANIEALLLEAQSAKEEDYAQNTAWQDFKQDITEAVAIIANESATQEEVDYRYNKLKESYDSIVPTNKTSLSTLVEQADGYKASDYTEGSYNNLVEAKNAATSILENDSATRIEFVEAQKNLETAIELLEKSEVPPVEDVFNTHLEITVEEALKVTEAELDKVVPVVAEEFRAALAEAQAVLANENATQSEVDASFERLSSAMQLLSFNKGDKANLVSLVERIEALDSNKYIATTWDKLAVVLEASRGVVADENALEAEVSESYTTLLRAFLELRLKPSKDALEGLINKAQGLDSSKYTAASFRAVEEALGAANEVFANEDATASEIARAEESLRNAINGLQASIGTGNNNSNNSGNSGSNSITENNNTAGNSGSTGSTSNSGKLPQTGGTPAVAVGLFGTILAGVGAIFSRKRK